MRTSVTTPYKKRLTAALALVLILSLAFALLGDIGIAPLAPCFWLLAALDGFLPLEVPWLPFLTAAFTVLCIFVAPCFKRVSIIFFIWLVLNYAGALWFILIYDGHS